MDTVEAQERSRLYIIIYGYSFVRLNLIRSFDRRSADLATRGGRRRPADVRPAQDTRETVT